MKYLLQLILICFGMTSILCQEFDFTKEETTFSNEDISLFADIYTPNHPKEERTGIIIIQGSGNSGRSNVWSFLIAEFLAENGYYVLLPDKRGCGKSEGDWKTSSFMDLKEDAIISARHLKNIIGLDKIGVMGLSQGARIAAMVSNNIELDFVINISGSSLSIENEIIHEVTNTAMEKGLNPEEIKEMLELHLLLEEYAFSEQRDWNALGQKFEEVKSKSWADFGATFPNTPDSWVWDFIKHHSQIVPAQEWSKVKQDIFIAYGADDANVSTYESVYLFQKEFHKKNKKNYEIHVYPTGHSLYQSGTTFHIDFREDLLKWLNKR